MCSASTIYTSLKAANLRPGQWAVFPGGGGGVGIQGVQLAEAMGLRPIVVDTGDDKEKLATSLGAEHFIDFKKVEDVAAEIVKITDGVGAHGVFVTAPQSYPSALSYLGSRVGGKVRGFCIAVAFGVSLTATRSCALPFPLLEPTTQVSLSRLATQVELNVAGYRRPGRCRL